MNKKFLFSSAVLFGGGTLMTITGILAYATLFLVLGIILMLMGGIPVLCVWFKELFQLLPESSDSASSADASDADNSFNKKS